MKRYSMLAILPLLVFSFNTNADPIVKHCNKKWGQNQQKVSLCIKKLRKARAVREKQLQELKKQLQQIQR